MHINPNERHTMYLATQDKVIDEKLHDIQAAAQIRIDEFGKLSWWRKTMSRREDLNQRILTDYTAFELWMNRRISQKVRESA